MTERMTDKLILVMTERLGDLKTTEAPFKQRPQQH